MIARPRPSSSDWEDFFLLLLLLVFFFHYYFFFHRCLLVGSLSIFFFFKTSSGWIECNFFLFRLSSGQAVSSGRFGSIFFFLQSVFWSE